MEHDRFDQAVLLGDLKNVEEILATYPYYANKLLSNGRTPLHNALLNRNKEMMKLLIDHNADVNMWPKQNLSPLYIAILFFDCSLGEILVRSGANVNECVSYEYKMTPLLHVAVDQGKVSLARTMIQWGADISAKDADNETVLYKALQLHRPVYLIREILEHCDRRELRVVDRMYRNYLHPAINAGDEEVTELLLAQPEIDPRIVHASGKTTLHFAALAERESVRIVQWMLEKGVDVNTVDRIFLNTPLHLALELEKSAMAKVLIENGARINAVNRKGYFPLYLAAKYCSVEVVELLIAKGANLRQLTPSGKSALHAACSQGAEDKIRSLIIHGIDLLIKDNVDRTAFQMLDNERTKAAKLIIQRLAVIKIAENKKLDDKDWQLVTTTPYMREHFDECAMELETMKKCKMYNCITMFYVVGVSEEKLSKCMRNKEFMTSFLASYSESDFFIYNDYVKCKLRRAERIMKSARAVENHLQMIFADHLTEYAVKLISRYLTVADLPDIKLCSDRSFF